MNILILSILLTLNSTARSDVGRKDETNVYKELISIEALMENFSPTLAVSIATAESSLNPRAIGRLGETGMFQIMPYKIYGKHDNDVRENIRRAIKILQYWKIHCPVKQKYQYLICYNSGYRHPRYPDLHPYYLKVMRLYESR